MKYIKKPIPVEAVQIPFSKPNPREYLTWRKKAPAWLTSSEIWMTDDGLVIPTLEGDMLCGWGNYIIQGVEGEIYPCRRDIFEATYTPVNE